jgi:tetratricopeptide (TPR) repeat protein
MKRRWAWVISLVLVLGFASSGCGMVKDFRKARHLKKAEQYYAEGKFAEATIEYRNVLHYDPENLDALKKLGLAYYENGQLGEAFPPLRRYHEQNTSDLEVRQKLGTIYLMGRAFDKARENAEAILAVEPLDLDALALYAEASQTPEEIVAAIRRIEDNRASLGSPDRVSRMLGVLYARNRDLPRAEQEFEAAVSSNPDSPESHLAMARLHLGKRELEKAEEEFKKAAELSPAGSFARLQLADFYLLTRRVDDAEATLEQITTEAPDAFPAWLRLAEIAFAQQRLDDAQKALDPVLEANPNDAGALIIQTRLHLARRETEEAIEVGTRAAKRHPGNALAHYVLAMAQAQAGNTALALTAAKDAVARAPALTDAVLLTARLEMQTGDFVSAIAGLRSYLEGASQDARGWEMLGRAQLGSQDPGAALQSFSQVAKLAPANPAGPYLVGLALRAQGRNAEAKQHFERSLAMAPRYIDPLAQLASMSLTEQKTDAALARVERQAMLEPNSGEIQYLLGQIHQVRGNQPQAEAAFLKALELNPNLSAAYVRLGAMYGASQQYDQAIGKLESALEKQPDEPVALMLLSIAHQMKGEAAKAREGYEKILEQNPNFAPAANNLAWMLADSGEDLQRALVLAQAARDAAPEDPQIADTLGWVLYKQGAYPRAEALLREAAEKLADNPEVLYHLGMAQTKMGREREAKATLARSLETSSSFAGAAEARATLASLGGTAP